LFRKITIAVVLATAVASAGLARTRAVGSGTTTTDAALLPIKVSGAAVTGIVTSVSGNIISLAGGLVTIDASNAKIMDERGAAVTVASIKAGNSIVASITTNVTTNTPIPASTIAVRSTPQVELTGQVSAVGATSLTVLGRTVNVDSNTSFGGRAHSLADVVVNDMVSASANVSVGALLAASLLVLAPPPVPSTLIHGTVKSISVDSWGITDRDGKEWAVVVNSQTKIAGDPKVGDSVEILANINNANQYVAVSIVKTPMATGSIVFSGTVQSITATVWVIHQSGENRDLKVAINEKTRITGDPKVNDGVNVTANVDAAGNYTATEIAKLGIVPPTVTLHGKVKSIVGPACPSTVCDYSLWTVGPAAGLGPDTQFQVNATTKVTGNPTLGDMVNVVLKSATAVPYIAISVEKQQ
jgi:hypothetical protein